jgi:hypothetical protein
VLRDFLDNYLCAVMRREFTRDDAIRDVAKAFALMQNKGWTGAIEYMSSKNKYFGPDEAYKARLATAKSHFLLGLALGETKHAKQPQH